jgi:hypothetical protein
MVRLGPGHYILKVFQNGIVDELATVFKGATYSPQWKRGAEPPDPPGAAKPRSTQPIEQGDQDGLPKALLEESLALIE